MFEDMLTIFTQLITKTRGTVGFIFSFGFNRTYYKYRVTNVCFIKQSFYDLNDLKRTYLLSFFTEGTHE